MPLLCFCKNEALISASHELCTGAASQQKTKKPKTFSKSISLFSSWLKLYKWTIVLILMWKWATLKPLKSLLKVTEYCYCHGSHMLTCHPRTIIHSYSNKLFSIFCKEINTRIWRVYNPLHVQSVILKCRRKK